VEKKKGGRNALLYSPSDYIPASEESKLIVTKCLTKEWGDSVRRNKALKGKKP